MGIIIRQGGMLTMVQDAGRFGYQTCGISVTGACDLGRTRSAIFWWETAKTPRGLR